jgi:hypothetical protein
LDAASSRGRGLKWSRAIGMQIEGVVKSVMRDSSVTSHSENKKTGRLKKTIAASPLLTKGLEKKSYFFFAAFFFAAGFFAAFFFAAGFFATFFFAAGFFAAFFFAAGFFAAFFFATFFFAAVFFLAVSIGPSFNVSYIKKST